MANRTENALNRGDFGDDFVWGVASAAFQIEGAWDGPVPLRRAPIPGLGAIPWPGVREAEAAVFSAVGVPAKPGGLLEILRRYRGHPGCRRMLITENGFGGHDHLVGGRVRDDLRILQGDEIGAGVDPGTARLLPPLQEPIRRT